MGSNEVCSYNPITPAYYSIPKAPMCKVEPDKQVCIDPAYKEDSFTSTASEPVLVSTNKKGKKSDKMSRKEAAMHVMEKVNTTMNVVRTAAPIVAHHQPIVIDILRTTGSAVSTTKTAGTIVAKYSPVIHAKTLAKAMNAQKMAKVLNTTANGVKKTGDVASKVVTIIKKPGVQAGIGAIGIGVGAYEIYDGINTIKKGDSAEGIYKTTVGALNVAGGIATAVGATTVAPALAAAGAGMAIGHFGNKEVKELGMLKDKNGKPQSASDRLGDRMWDIHESVKNSTGSSVLGHIAAGGAGILMLPTAGAVAVGGAVAGGAKHVWNWITK